MFVSYFKDRLQFTKVGTVMSSGAIIEHGVYQGSPLGPLLYIIYINDIVRVHSDVFCNMSGAERGGGRGGGGPGNCNY